MLLDDQLRPAGTGIDLGRTLYADWRSIELVSVADRLVSIQATDDGVRIRTFVGRDLREPAAAPTLLGAGTYSEYAPTSRTDTALKQRTVAAIGAGQLRNSVIVAAMDFVEVRVWVFDPLTGVVAGPVQVDSSTAYRTPGVAGENVGGTVGICYPDGTPGRDADAL
jgi:hypothetical protein